MKVETTDKDYEMVAQQKEKDNNVSNCKDDGKDLSKKQKIIISVVFVVILLVAAAVLMGVFIPKALEQKANVNWESSERASMNNQTMIVNTYTIKDEEGKLDIEIIYQREIRNTTRLLHDGRILQTEETSGPECFYAKDIKTNMTFQSCNTEEEPESYIDPEVVQRMMMEEDPSNSTRMLQQGEDLFTYLESFNQKFNEEGSGYKFEWQTRRVISQSEYEQHILEIPKDQQNFDITIPQQLFNDGASPQSNQQQEQNRRILGYQQLMENAVKNTFEKVETVIKKKAPIIVQISGAAIGMAVRGTPFTKTDFSIGDSIVKSCLPQNFKGKPLIICKKITIIKENLKQAVSNKAGEYLVDTETLKIVGVIKKTK